MSDQLSATPVQPAILSSPPVKLWTPRAVGYIAFLLGFPGGFALVALNRVRMGLTNKAITFLIGGAIQSLVIILLSLLLPGQVANVLSLVVNIGMAFYLNNQTQQDINAFKVTNREVQKAHWFAGILISLLTLGIFFVFGLVIVFIWILVGLPIPE